MKNNINQEDLQVVSDRFGLGKVSESQSLEDGLVNLSFKVTTNRGNFVFQSLSPIFDERAINGYEEVQRYLRTNGVHVPVLLKSTQEQPFYRNGEGLWRAFEYVPNKRLNETTPKIAYEIARKLRRFHEIMRDSGFKPEFELEGFHDTPRIIDNLKSCFKINNANYKKQARLAEREYDFICSRIESHYLPKDLPQTLIHGDPKPQNFLFDESGRVISMLDLDTIMQGTELIDLGDGFRSWCETPEKEFRGDIFEAGIEGYFNCSEFIGEKKPAFDEELVMKSVGLITLELAARFLIDSFEEKYFRLNTNKYTSLAEQGLKRCQAQLKYYSNFSIEFAKRKHFYGEDK